jgi:hypothetical protein
MMHDAIQTFFVVQVAVERAICTVSNIGNELVGEYVRTPVKEHLRNFIGVSANGTSTGDVDRLNTEIESIRSELRTLRSDLRQMQQSAV